MEKISFQMLVAGLKILFRDSDSFKEVQGGCLSVDRVAVRMESFSSELHIPWDAVAVEYACAWEIIVGEIAAKFDPTHVSKFNFILY